MFKTSKISKKLHIKCMSSKTIFQSNIHVSPPTMQYISELQDCTKQLSEQNRREFFNSNGIDYDNIKKYYDYVNYIENIYNNNNNYNIFNNIYSAFITIFTTMIKIIIRICNRRF